jgi:hypothetical protein
MNRAPIEVLDPRDAKRRHEYGTIIIDVGSDFQFKEHSSEEMVPILYRT